jgi:hypothetical protein
MDTLEDNILKLTYDTVVLLQEKVKDQTISPSEISAVLRLAKNAGVVNSVTKIETTNSDTTNNQDNSILDYIRELKEELANDLTKGL